MSNTTAADLSRIRRGRVLTQTEQDRAIVLFGRGLTRDEVIKKLRISKATWQNTIEEMPLFKAAWDTAQANRLQEVEHVAYKVALGGLKTVKLTYVAQLDKNGGPVRDAEGRPTMLLHKREVTVTPPDWRAVEFILRTRLPETYSTKALAHEHNVESLDVIRAYLEGKAKEAAKSQPVALPPAAQGGA